MASLPLRFPSNFRNFSVSASSNGAPLGVPQQGGPVIVEIPLDKIRRPLMRTRANDPEKVKDLMDSIQEIGLQVPVSLVVTDTRLINVSAFQQYVVKFDAEQKKL